MDSEANLSDLVGSDLFSDDLSAYEPNESSSGESEDHESDEIGCVFERLPAPGEAHVARKRSMNRSSKGKGDKKRKKESSGRSTTAPRISCQKRVDQYPGEYLTVSAGKLMCEVCHVEVARKNSIVKKHVQSCRHTQAKGQRAKAKSHQQLLSRSWDKYKETHKDAVRGTGLSDAVPTDTIMRRANVVEGFLKAGIPLSKIDDVRPLLEANNARLTYSTHMASLIPFLLEKEQKALRQEIAAASHVAIIFDGSTHLGEALAVVVRLVDEKFSVHQRLVRLHILEKSLNAAQLVREVVAVVCTELQISPAKVTAMIRDGAAVNTAAVSTLKELLFPDVLDVKCFAHSLDVVGRKFELPILNQFSQWWVDLFAHSPAARLAWKARTGVAPKSFSPTRWWSRWEVLHQVLQFYGDAEPFIRECTFSPATRQHLLQIFEDEDSAVQF